MKKICPPFLLVISALLLNTAKAQQSDQNASIEKTIDSIMAIFTGVDKPGSIIGIIKEGQLIFQKGYGMADLDLQKPNTAQTVYNIASGSKQFTALVIASLIQQQKI